MTIYERVGPDRLKQEEYRSFLDNDMHLAAEYGSSPAIFARNRAEWALASSGYTVQAVDTPVPCRHEGWDEGKAEANARVRDGQEFYVRTSLEIGQGQEAMERASGDMGCI